MAAIPLIFHLLGHGFTESGLYVPIGADSLRIMSAGTEVVSLVAAGAPVGTQVVGVGALNGPGNGMLRDVGGALQWRAPGSSSFGDAIEIPTVGTYLVLDGDDRNKWVRVQVFPDFLAGPNRAQVELWEVWNNATASDDVSAAEASAGDVETYTLTMQNDGPATLHNTVAWIDVAVSDIEISDDGAVWVTPTTEGTGLAFPDIAPGATDTLHVRRTIGAAAPANPAVLTDLRFAFDTAA